MNQVNKYRRLARSWQIGEFVLGIVTLVYFIMYPRDTLSDFLVLSSLGLILRFSYSKIGLFRPSVCPFSRVDSLVVILTIILFLFAWTYGGMTGKLSSSNIIKSLLITIVYFYYAFIQHYLAQRYLALRLLHAIKKNGVILRYGFRAEIIAGLMTGLIFGLIHIPYPHLILPAMIGGFLYSFYFLTTGRLWVVVSSHALISSTVLFWYLDDNPFTELIMLFS